MLQLHSAVVEFSETGKVDMALVTPSVDNAALRFREFGPHVSQVLVLRVGFLSKPESRYLTVDRGVFGRTFSVIAAIIWQPIRLAVGSGWVSQDR
jgi:hypothetical protein